MRRMKSYKLHPKYDFQALFADLAMVQCRKAVRLGDTVQRVAIMRKPPIENYAVVAGWGVIDEALSNTDILKLVKQKMYYKDVCKNLQLPNGTFCAGNAGAKDDIAFKGYPPLGDSGGPLVISNLI